MTIKKKIFTMGGVAFILFVILALMNIWTHREVLSNLQIRDDVSGKLADIQEFVKWKSMLIQSVSDIVKSGHVPSYSAKQFNPPTNSHREERDLLIQSGETLVGIIGEKERTSLNVENTFNELRQHINTLYYKLDEQIATVLATAQLEQVLGEDTSTKNSLAPYVLKSLNQLTLVALNSLVSRNVTHASRNIIVKNKQFLSSQLQIIDKDGSIAALFWELFTQIESINTFILESDSTLTLLDSRISEANANFDIIAGRTVIDSIVAEVQADLENANKKLEKSSRRTLVTVGLFLLIVPVLVIIVGILGLNKVIIGPISDLMRAMKNVENGKFDITAPVRAQDEIGVLARAFNIMAGEIEVKVTAMAQLNQVLQKSEERLQLSEERLELALAGANEGIWDWSMQKDTIHFDSRYYTMAGYEPYEFPEALEEWEKRVHPDDIDSVKVAINEYFANELMDFDVDFRFLCKDRKFMWIRGKGKIVAWDKDGNPCRFIGTHSDITNIKRAEEELRSLRNYMSNIIDSMPSMLIGVDSRGDVTQWNKTAEKITGKSVESALGKGIDELLPHLSSVREKINESIRTRQILHEQKKSQSPGIQICYEEVTIYPLITNSVEGAAIRIDDVTEKIHLEEMMIQSEKMLSVGGLAAGMAHEINNPLAGMLQTVSVMKNRLKDNIDIAANKNAAEKAGTTMESIEKFMLFRGIPRMLDTITTSGHRVAELVDNMLNFSRKEDSTVSSHNLIELIDKTLELAATDYDLKKQYDFKLIEIIRDDSEEMPCIPCQGTKIQQVLLNILTNGAQAMQNAQTKTPRFTLRTYTEKQRNMVCLEIEDNGPGIDEAIRKRVFEPFFTTKPVGQGTGLGLSISYFIITENHHGEMAVESRPGWGTKFIIRLPANGK